MLTTFNNSKHRRAFWAISGGPPASQKITQPASRKIQYIVLFQKLFWNGVSEYSGITFQPLPSQMAPNLKLQTASRQPDKWKVPGFGVMLRVSVHAFTFKNNHRREKLINAWIKGDRYTNLCVLRFQSLDYEVKVCFFLHHITTRLRSVSGFLQSQKGARMNWCFRQQRENCFFYCPHVKKKN